MLSLLIAVLPSWVKIRYLRARGASIGRNCYIGFSIVDAKRICIGDEVHIGHFNALWRLESLSLESGSRLTMFNWITGARTGSFLLGRNSAITRLHFFEASGNISIGANCIIAGRNSHFFTHGISAVNLDDIRPIVVGDWCYIGSSSRFVPGVCIPAHCFVGMGAVVTKSFTDEYCLIAGNPASVKKRFLPTDLYFARDHLPHAHHSASYSG